MSSSCVAFSAASSFDNVALQVLMSIENLQKMTDNVKHCVLRSALIFQKYKKKIVLTKYLIFSMCKLVTQVKSVHFIWGHCSFIASLDAQMKIKITASVRKQAAAHTALVPELS